MTVKKGGLQFFSVNGSVRMNNSPQVGFDIKLEIGFVNDLATSIPGTQKTYNLLKL
jgi:hypothetical protein